MIYRADEEVELLVKRFEERTLMKDEWTHAAHLTVGLYYCFHHSFGEAKNLMRDGIHWLNDAHGTPNTDSSGYHETLTVFWLRKIADFVRSHEEEKSLSVLANILIASYNNPQLPLEIYSRELLFSAEARQKHVVPDLMSFSTITATPVFAL